MTRRRTIWCRGGERFRKRTSPDAATRLLGARHRGLRWTVGIDLWPSANLGERAAPAVATAVVAAARAAGHAQASATSPGLTIFILWTTSFPVLIVILRKRQTDVKKKRNRGH